MASSKDEKITALSTTKFNTTSTFSSSNLSSKTIFHAYRVKEHQLILYTVPAKEIKPLRDALKKTCRNNKEFKDRWRDPRTAEYFIHKPCTWFTRPPSTVHVGGTVEAPLACRYKTAHFWSRCDVDFNTDVRLNDKGVSLPPLRPCSVKQDTNAEAEKLPEKIAMTWTSFFGRQYEFTFKGVKFYWRGSPQVLPTSAPAFWQGFVHGHHLKLVAELPEEKQAARGFLLNNVAKTKPERKEIMIASWTAGVGIKKHGKFAIHNEELQELVEHFPSLSEDRQQLIELIVATGVGMLKQEKAKRHVIRDLMQVVVTLAQIPSDISG